MTLFNEYNKNYPHTAFDLSQEDRLEIKNIKWESFALPRFNSQRSTNSFGQWMIGHQDEPREDGTFEPVGIKYKAAMPSGMDYGKVSEKIKILDGESHLWAKLFNCILGMEVGYIFNQDYAREFIELALENGDDKNPSDVLINGGFEEIEPLDVHGEKYRRFFMEKENGSFDVVLSNHHLKLTFEEDGKNHWNNLIYFHLGQQNHNGDKWIPTFWSPQIKSPLSSAAKMSVKMAKEWKPVNVLTGKNKKGFKL